MCELIRIPDTRRRMMYGIAGQILGRLAFHTQLDPEIFHSYALTHHDLGARCNID